MQRADDNRAQIDQLLQVTQLTGSTRMLKPARACTWLSLHKPEE